MILGIRFPIYVFASAAACLLLFTHAFFAQETFYDFLILITTAKLPLALIYNFGFVSFATIGMMFLKVFVGELRQLEVEELVESGRSFLMDTILFLILSTPTINNKEVSAKALVICISSIASLKALHLIAQIRIAHLFELGLPRMTVLYRLFSFMSILLITDTVAVYAFIRLMSKESSLYIWILFECMGMLASSVTNLLKFAIHFTDLRMTSGWSSKNIYIFYIDMLHDTANLVIFLSFMIVFFLNHPNRLPLYMTADIFHVLKTLIGKIGSFRRYRELTKNMKQRFPDATAEELAEAERCIICRDLLQEGAKKLPCGHVFHQDCVKSWFVQQQSCPTCRFEIPVNAEATSNNVEEVVEVEEVAESLESQRSPEFTEGSEQNLAVNSKSSEAPEDENQCFAVYIQQPTLSTRLQQWKSSLMTSRICTQFHSFKTKIHQFLQLLIRPHLLADWVQRLIVSRDNPSGNQIPRADKSSHHDSYGDFDQGTESRKRAADSYYDWENNCMPLHDNRYNYFIHPVYRRKNQRPIELRNEDFHRCPSDVFNSRSLDKYIRYICRKEHQKQIQSLEKAVNADFDDTKCFLLTAESALQTMMEIQRIKAEYEMQ